MSEIVRFIGWFVKRYAEPLLVTIYIITTGSISVFTSSVFINYRGGIEDAGWVAAILIMVMVAGIGSLVISLALAVGISIFEFVVGVWSDYRKDYPTRKRKQKDA